MRPSSKDMLLKMVSKRPEHEVVVAGGTEGTSQEPVRYSYMLQVMLLMLMQGAQPQVAPCLEMTIAEPQTSTSGR
jgi:hypothetical protein